MPDLCMLLIYVSNSVAVYWLFMIGLSEEQIFLVYWLKPTSHDQKYLLTSTTVCTFPGNPLPQRDKQRNDQWWSVVDNHQHRQSRVYLLWRHGPCAHISYTRACGGELTGRPLLMCFPATVLQRRVWELNVCFYIILLVWREALEISCLM